MMIFACNMGTIIPASIQTSSPLWNGTEGVHVIRICAMFAETSGKQSPLAAGDHPF